MAIQQTEQGTVTLTFSQDVPATPGNVAAAFESLVAYMRQNLPGDVIVQQPFAYSGSESGFSIVVTIQSPLRPGFPANLNI